MPVQLFTIARNTFIESLRQPVLLILVLTCGIFQVFNTWSAGFAMGQTEAAEVEGDNKLLLDIGLATVFVLATLAAAFISTSALSREIENKTVLTIVSKPVSRTLLILGKYLGVSGAIAMAVIPMLIALLWGIRHGVMSTAADTLDQPVLTFSLVALGLSLAAGAWANYFYGWSFPQVSLSLLVPLCVVGFVLTLAFNRTWDIQPLFTDLKPKITLACLTLTLAVFVLTAVAIAASTRLGQVMTIVVCVGVFIASLLSNFFVGRYAFQNQVIGEIAQATAATSLETAFDTPGQTYTVVLKNPPALPLKPGTPFYYGPNPSGFDLSVPAFSALPPEQFDEDRILRAETPSGVVVTKVDDLTITIRHTGPAPLRGVRPPETDDYVFAGPTRTRPLLLAAWAVIPNLQYFWLLDAVTQNRPVPGSYILMATGYAACQIGAFLCLAVFLFQKRDVG